MFVGAAVTVRANIGDVNPPAETFRLDDPAANPVIVPVDDTLASAGMELVHPLATVP
jgi:hypothetical protein